MNPLSRQIQPSDIITQKQQAQSPATGKKAILETNAQKVGMLSPVPPQGASSPVRHVQGITPNTSQFQALNPAPLLQSVKTPPPNAPQIQGSSLTHKPKVEEETSPKRLAELMQGTKMEIIATNMLPETTTFKGKILAKTTLNDIKSSEEKKIPLESVRDATVGSLALGITNATREKMVVSGNQLKFTDVSKSLPSTNHFGRALDKHGNEDLITPYRSELLTLPQNYKTLENKDLDDIKKQLKQIRENSEKAPLPGVSEESKQALRERIGNMERALQKKEIKNLRDLAFAAYPDYKLTLAFQIAAKLITDAKWHNKRLSAKDSPENLQKLQQEISKIGTGTDVGIHTLIGICTINNYDVSIIEKICSSNMNFDDVVDLIGKVINRTADDRFKEFDYEQRIKPDAATVKRVNEQVYQNIAKKYS